MLFSLFLVSLDGDIVECDRCGISVHEGQFCLLQQCHLGSTDWRGPFSEYLDPQRQCLLHHNLSKTVIFKTCVPIIIHVTDVVQLAGTK